MYAAKGLTLSSCADETHIIYVDGKQVNSNPAVNDWTQTIITPIPSNARVIAISVTNIQNNAGFKASFSDGSVVTDGSWKCSEKFTDGWQRVDFNDSLWAAPTTTGSANCNGINANAKWLWTDKYYKSLITIYCRKTLSKTFFMCTRKSIGLYVKKVSACARTL